MYKIFLTKQVEKECRKRGANFKKEIISILNTLRQNPFPQKSENLSGSLSFIHSYRFSFGGTSFRLAYEVDGDKKILTVIMVGPRENFYDILRKKLH